MHEPNGHRSQELVPAERTDGVEILIVSVPVEVGVAVRVLLATIEDPGAAMAYLLIFCVGVAAGMAVLTTVIGLPFWVARARSMQINRWLTIGSGILSLAFGIYLAYQIGYIDGLFTGDFHWENA